jgi:dipeptidyl aminopeptidase/acylaminoacyl peptidase
VAFQDGTSIAVSRIDGSQRQTLSGDVPYARSPTFSPDGRLVAFVAPATAEALGGPLMIASADGSSSTAIISGGVSVAASEVTSLAWSPDAAMVAFSGQDGDTLRIYVAAADGTGTTAITDASARRDLPTWSPDGSWIGFREKSLDGTQQRLRMVRPDGSDVQDIAAVFAADGVLSKYRWTWHDTADAGNRGPLSYWFSPGFGATTAAAYIDLGFQHNNQPWTGAPGGFVDWGLPWSPDGLQMAILTREEGVILADSDETAPYNGHVRRLGPILDCWVDWAPDSTGLYGGAPGDCNRTLLVPLADPETTFELAGSSSGLASWQPLERAREP